MLPYNKKLVSNAKTLRKNMTDEEKHLWYDYLKKLPFTVRRQHNIENYIVDFYIAEVKLVIEVDGLHHDMPEKKKEDELRDRALTKWGIKVLRCSNRSIHNNFNDVIEYIDKTIRKRLTVLSNDSCSSETDFHS